MEVLCKDMTLGFYNEFGIYNIPIEQYDIGRIISITFANQGEVFQIPDNTLVFLKALKPDGNEINTDQYCYVNKKENTVEICVFNQLSIAAGVVKCEIILANSEGQRYTSSHFNIVVNRSVNNDEHLKSMDQYRDIVGILVEMEGLRSELISKSDILDTNDKIKTDKLYAASTEQKGIVQLVDSVESDSTTDAATPKSVKTVNDSLNDTKNLVTELTTSKVNITDIIDNLTSSSTDKPLSSNQGRILNELLTELTSAVDDKVDQISGKGLSSNDYTDSEKNKLNGMDNRIDTLLEKLAGALIPMGTVNFANLPELANAESGWLYNISDQFTTTSDFKEGAEHVIPAGANVYKTADGYWAILARTPVTSVNGETGNVILTPESIGASTFRGIIGEIASGIASNSLVQYGITKDDTVYEVFNKLPQFSFTMINSNSQGNNFSYSLPEERGCALIFKYYNDNRGWLEFHSYGDLGSIYYAKILDDQISNWIKYVGSNSVLTTEDQLNANTEPSNVAGAMVMKEMFNNVFKKVRQSNIWIGPRWGRVIETEYCKLIGNVIHAKFKINELYLQGTQWMATIHCAIQHASVTIGEAVAYVPATESYYPLAVFPADGLLTIGYLAGMPTYTNPDTGSYYANAIITAKIAVSPT